MEWVTSPPVTVPSKRNTLQPYLSAMAENKGKWLVLRRDANNRALVYYLRKRYPQLEVTSAQNETDAEKWDIYARHREGV